MKVSIMMRSKDVFKKKRIFSNVYESFNDFSKGTSIEQAIMPNSNDVSVAHIPLDAIVETISTLEEAFLLMEPSFFFLVVGS